MSWVKTTDDVGVKGYVITLTNFAYKPSALTFTTPTNAATYTLRNLPRGSSWAIRIAGYDAAGNVGGASPYLFLALLP